MSQLQTITAHSSLFNLINMMVWNLHNANIWPFFMCALTIFNVQTCELPNSRLKCNGMDSEGLHYIC